MFSKREANKFPSLNILIVRMVWIQLLTFGFDLIIFRTEQRKYLDSDAGGGGASVGHAGRHSHDHRHQMSPVTTSFNYM